jgi:cytochrome c biogenesis protein CcdA
MVTGIGYLGAFLGGVLSLLSPCSGLLLPAFFACAFTGPARLLGRTAVFYAGLAGVLVPLGLGSSAASTLVYGHQAALTTAAGLLLIGFGVMQLAGAGFAIPGLARLRVKIRGDSALAVLALGAVSGLAGFCAGPVLGAVLTVAAVSGQPLRGSALLAVYAAGMAAPLFVLAAAWDRFGIGHRRWLRGKGIRFGPLRLHTNSLLSGLIFTGLGVIFLCCQGTAGLAGLLAPPGLGSWNNRLETAVTTIQAHVPDLAVIAAAAAAVVAVTAWRLRRITGNPARYRTKDHRAGQVRHLADIPGRHRQPADADAPGKNVNLGDPGGGDSASRDGGQS